MCKSNYPPPPEMRADEPPSYFRGHVYYYDSWSDDNCRWVLYDGKNKIRFVTRKSLEDYVIEQQAKTPERAVSLLMRAHARAQRSYLDLDDAAAQLDGNYRVNLQAIALNLRKLTDNIDTIISQLITK